MKADFVFEFDEERFEVERLLVEGDVVEPGQVAFRLSRSDGFTAPHVQDLVVPFGGVFVWDESAGFGVARAVEEEGPVGVSFEIYAISEGTAILEARAKARATGKLIGRVLFTEQIEAAKWEVVFAQMRHEPIDPMPLVMVWPAGLEEKLEHYLWLNGLGSKRANGSHVRNMLQIIESSMTKGAVS